MAWKSKIGSYIIISLIIVTFLLRIPILFVRYFDPDEFQHLHAAFSLYNGLIPYRDFFEHHTPFIWFLLAPLYPIFGADIPLIYAARILMLIFTAGIFYLTYLLGKRFYSSDIGLLATLFLSCMIMFLEQTIEIRPDVPETFFLLLSLLFITRGITEKANKWYVLSGLAIGISILFSQKALFALVGLVAIFVWIFIENRFAHEQDRPKNQSIKEFFLFISGLVIPIFLTCCFFLVLGYLTEFINLNLIINLRWKVRFSPSVFLIPSFKQNTFFWTLGIMGLLLATIDLHNKDERLKGSFTMLLSAYALLIGLFLIPVPYKEYYVMVLPLLAIYCAYTLKIIISFSISEKPIIKWNLIRFIISVLTFIIALCYMLDFIQPSLLNSKIAYEIICGILVILIILTLLKGKRNIALLLASIGIIIFPLQQIYHQTERSNTGQLEDIKFIMNNTTPDDTVLDGWSGFGVFRPHAYYYHFLHNEVRAMLSNDDLADNLISALKEKRTKVIIYDGSVKALPQQVQNYITQNYVYSGQGNIYLLKRIQ